MGLVSSKETPEEQAYSTPPKMGSHKRLLDLEFDPRSPSTGISRTPIVVEKTPDTSIDPRSPTPGILRTPITSLDDYVPVDAKMPLMLHEENEVDQDSKKEIDFDVEDKLLQDNENLIQEGLQKMTVVDKDLTDSALKAIYHDKSDTVLTKKHPKSQQPKQLFPAKKLTNVHKDSTRSPLAMRTNDMNSPRNIVQRKQVKRVEKSKSCALEAMTGYGVEDKENIKM